MSVHENDTAARAAPSNESAKGSGQPETSPEKRPEFLTARPMQEALKSGTSDAPSHAQPKAEPVKPQPQPAPQAQQNAQAPAASGPNRAGAMPPPRKPQQMGPVRPAASYARIEKRHRMIFVSFLVLVLAPVLISAWYLWARAEDQYASYVGFSVRSESNPGAPEIMGGLSTLVGMTSSSSSDTDILYKFIQSRDLVARINERLDLREIWSRAEGDPVFAYRGDGSIEDLLENWERKVRVYYDNGMIDIRVLAFRPEDSHAIAQAILDEGTIRINELNDIAREDAMRYARLELDQAVERLKAARQAVTEFRNQHQLVDPSAVVQGQVGVVASLQQQLAEELVSLGMLRANAQPNDPRIAQGELRIAVIREQIEAERQVFGSNTATGEALSDVVGQYEGLSVDRHFAETSYTAALASFEAARAEAQKQSRYLAAYIRPTFAESAEYPERAKLLLIFGGFLMLIWTIGVLVYYSLRDRR